MDCKSPFQTDNHFDFGENSHVSRKDGKIIQENGDVKDNDGRERLLSQRSDSRENGILRRSSLIRHDSRRNRVKKTVSFTSMPSEKKITSVSDCLTFMTRGTKLIKVRSNSRQYFRTFTLDSDKSAIRWTPTSKKADLAKVSISAMKEVLVGKHTDIFRSRDAADCAEECSFSIVYGDNYETLDLLASTPEEANIWVTGLMALMASLNGGAKSGLHSDNFNYDERDLWLTECFGKLATAAGGGDCLSEDQIVGLISDICPTLPASRIRQRIKEFQWTKVDEGSLIDVNSFLEIYKELATRPEIYHLLIRYANKEYMTVDDLMTFLESEQGVTNVSREYATEVIERFEPSASSKINCHLYIEGLTRFLLSEDCDVFDPVHKIVCQDMRQPLSHYFVASSHNTYLVEDQLKGPSSVEGYVQALLNGCRFIEVDVWDGPDDEPVIFHGHTLTSKIPLRSTLEAIRKHAFDRSQYPLILCIEVHCSTKLQLIMVEMLKSLLGPMLLSTPVDASLDKLPSPQELRNKILILGRKLPEISSTDGLSSGEVTEDDESAESIKQRNNERSSSTKRMRLSREFSNMINYCQFRRFDSFGCSSTHDKFYHVGSMQECTATKLANLIPEEFVQHTKRFLTRVYPSGMRVDSSNFNPQDMWNCGCQIVALNYQSVGPMMDLNMGRFAQNGGCGYILKPAVMREDFAVYNANHKEIPGVMPQTLHIKIISAINLPKPSGAATKGDVIDPFTKLEIFGIPADCSEFRTKTVPNNGFNPIFDETFEFQLTFPELALVRFAIIDDECIGDDFVGQYTIPVECLQTGYRHVRLRSLYGKELPNCYLFVHVALTNKKGGGKATRTGISGLLLRSRRTVEELKLIGIKVIDDIVKSVTPAFKESIELKESSENATCVFKEECGQNQSASLRQCMRVLLQRFSSPGIDGPTLKVQIKDGFPELILGVSASETPRKVLTAFENLISQCRNLIENSDRVADSLHAAHASLLEQYEDFENLAAQTGFKGKKVTKSAEKLNWNVRLIKGHADLLVQTKSFCQESIRKICDALPATSTP